MGQFNTAKAVLSFLAVLGWIIVGLGVLAFFYLFSNVGLIGALSAIGVVAVGLINVAVAQMGLAQIATAENTSAIYALLQQESGVKRGKGVSSAYGGQQQGGLAKNAGDRVKSFKGYEILKEQSGVSVGGEKYSNVLEAEKAINNKIKGDH